MKIELRGTLTEQDLRSALWLHVAPRRTYAVLGILVLALAIAALWLSFFGARPNSSWQKWAILGVLLYLPAHVWIYVPYRIRRTLRQYKALQREFTFSPRDEGFTTVTEGTNSIVPWTDFLKWKESQKIFLMYVTDDMYHLVPKRLFAQPADIETFRDILRSRIGNR